MHAQALTGRDLLLVIALISWAPASLVAQTSSVFSTGLPAGDQEKPAERFPRVEWEDHPSLRLGRGTRIDFRARFQWDVRHSEAPFGDNDDVESGAGDLARRRIGIEGEIFNIVDYQVERELESFDPWRDVYADYKQFEVVRVKAGKFKLPFSLDENTSATNLDFVYRSRAADFLAPGRDVGFMLHGRLAAGRLRYEAGVFRHDGSNARSADSERVYGGRTFAGRIQVLPFRSSKGQWRNLSAGH